MGRAEKPSAHRERLPVQRPCPPEVPLVVQKVGQQAVIWCANNRTYAVVAKGQPKDLTPIVTYMKAHVR